MVISRRGLLAAGSLLIPGAACAADQGVAYPFEVTRNTPWAAVNLDGKDPPLPFIIDTGSSGFAIRKSKAQELGLRKYGRTSMQAAVGRARVDVYGASVVLGGVVREPWLPMAAIADLRPPMQGLIPMARFKIMGMDFDSRQVLIASHLPDLSGYEALDLDAGRGEQGSLDRMGAFSNDDINQLNKNHAPVIDAEFNGERVKLMVDTGYSGGLFLYPDYVKRKGLWDAFEGHQASQVTTVAQTATARDARADRLRVGKLVFAKPIVTLGNPRDSDLDGMNTHVGLIGMEFLRRLNFIADAQRRKIWIRPNSAISDGYRYDRAGAEVAFVEGVARITELNPGSPADRAGLKLGDKVVGWRGKDGLDGLSWALKGAPGTTVELQVEREARPQMIAVTLEETI